jgi:hypothetical protein
VGNYTSKSGFTLQFHSASGTRFRQVKPPLFFVWPRRGNPRLAGLNKGFPNEGQAEKSKAWACQNLVPEALTSPARGQERSPLQALRLFPNPAQDLVFLELDLPYSAPVRAIVQDAVGRQLAIADFAGQAGLQRFELRSAHWPPGTYWVSVIVDGHREVRLVEKF